jgi:acyl carrier protein
MTSWPVTSNGKLDRKALPEPVMERTGGYVAPRSELERELAQLWSQVLGVSEVGIHDNFFELGGDSLQATRLIAHLRTDQAVSIQLRAFFAQPSVAGMVELVTAHRQEQAHTRQVLLNDADVMQDSQEFVL